MFGIGFYKGQPTEYVIKYVAGRPVAAGHGLAFYYWRHKTQIASVPTASTDGYFVFNEVAGDFQVVTLQGQFTYRISEPERAAELLNFTVDPSTRTYLADPTERVVQRISNVIQTRVRDELRDLPLEQALKQSQPIATRVCAEIVEGSLVGPLGVELLGLHVQSAKPTPEVATALEAEYRESLLQKADEATYARRAEAVEMERKIKENELNTDIALEEQRERLIDLQGENIQREADYKGRALEREAQSRAKALELEAEARAEAMKLETAASADVDATKILALALRELSSRADKLLAALRPQSDIDAE